MVSARLAAPVLAVSLVSALATQGCAVMAVPAVGSALSGGVGGAVRAGVSTMGGVTARTFSVPLPELYAGVRATLSRLEFAPPDEEVDQERITFRVEGIDRTVRIDLHPITPAITQMRVTVRKNAFTRDTATATELVAQVGETLQGWPAALPRAGVRPTQRRASPMPR
jgi:hypothetical protein